MKTPYFHCKISFLFSALTSQIVEKHLKSTTIEGLHKLINDYQQMEEFKFIQTISYQSPAKAIVERSMVRSSKKVSLSAFKNCIKKIDKEIIYEHGTATAFSN